MILVPANKVEKIKYFSTLLGLIFIEITRGPSIFHGLSLEQRVDHTCYIIKYSVTVLVLYDK